MPGSPAASPRLAIPRYDNLDGVNFAGQVNAISDMIDLKVARLSDYIIDLLVNRPAASIAKRRFYATDLGLEFIDTGTAWVPVGIPIGGGFTWYGANDPTPELVLADGRSISRTTFSALFAKLGTTFGAGNGSTTFNIPNTVGKVTVHPDGFITRGATGGAKTHTLTSAEMPSHRHDYSDLVIATSHSLAASPPQQNAATSWAEQTESTSFVGGGAAHNNMQPYLGAPQAIRIL